VIDSGATVLLMNVSWYYFVACGVGIPMHDLNRGFLTAFRDRDRDRDVTIHIHMQIPALEQ